VRGIPIVTTVYQQTTTDPRQITQDQRGPFTVTASLGESIASQSVTLTSSLEMTLTLS
jgi:hypothetical protein